MVVLDLNFWIFISIAIASVISLIEFSATMNAWEEPMAYSPKVIYDNTEMNWFGCWFCFISIRLVSPLFTIFGLIIIPIAYLIDFIKWLFTVGREDD